MSDDASGEDVAKLARITFELELVSENWPPISHETLWVRPTTLENGVLVASVPLFVFGVAVDDLILVTVDNDRGELQFEQVLHPSGNSTFRLLLTADAPRLPLEQLLALYQCQWETGLVSNHLGVNIPAWVDCGAVLIELWGLRDQGQLEIEEGAMSDLHIRRMRGSRN